jgi:hypothetical protein
MALPLPILALALANPTMLGIVLHTKSIIATRGFMI